MKRKMSKLNKKAEDESLESLRNIGKVIAGKLAKIGITTKSQFLKQDPYKVFNRLLTEVDPTLCRCALAAVVGATKDVPWHVITKQSSKEFERRYPKHRWGGC